MSYLVTKKNAKYFEPILNTLCTWVLNSTNPQSEVQAVMKTTSYKKYMEPDLRWPQDGEDIIELVFGNFARIVLDMDIDERFMQYGR